MAEGKGLTRFLRVVFDRLSARKAADDLIASLSSAGNEAGKAFLKQLRSAFDQRMAKLREDLARGIIDEKEFKKQSEVAAKAFNEGLLKSIDEARRRGELTDKEYVKLTRTLKRVGEEGASTAGMLVDGFKRVAATLGIVFGLDRVVAFVKASVDAAIESEALWNRVGGAVARAGRDWGEMEARVKGIADQLRTTAAVGDEEFAAALDRMLALTGDVNLSLSQMNFLTDIAARFFGGDMVQAADFLGKALSGNVRVFRELGIRVTDVNEGLAILRERAAGAAANELRTLEGRMRLLREVFGDTRKELGFFLLRMAGDSDSAEVAANRYVLALDKIANWFKTHRIVGWIGGGPLPIPIIGKTLGSEAKPAARGGSGIDSDIPVIIPDTPPTAPRASRDKELPKLGWWDMSHRLAGDKTSMLEQITGIDEKENEEQAQRFMSPWQKALGSIAQEVETQNGLFAQLGEAWAGGGLRGLAMFAAGKIKQNLASVIEELAKAVASFALGDPAHAAMHAKAALGFGEAAAAWRVAQGAFGGGGGGGGVAGLGGSGNVGGSSADRAQPLQPEVHVHVDPFNPSNAVHQRIVADGVIKGFERKGYRVVVHND